MFSYKLVVADVRIRSYYGATERVGCRYSKLGETGWSGAIGHQGQGSFASSDEAWFFGAKETGG